MNRHIHLGLGRFHRAHQAFYLQNSGYAITAFSMRSETEAVALREADHEYKLVILGEGEREEQNMTVIDEALFVQRDTNRLWELMADPEITTLTLTITEKGYGALPDGNLDLENQRLQESAVAYLVKGLSRRQSQNSQPINILSCDNLRENGRLLERLCRQWSEAAECPFDHELVSFPNSMVDRIVPAGPNPLEIRTEAFHQWVIEDKFVGARPSWEQEGLHFVPDVEPFETLKLGLLNASHSFLAYYGQLQGHEFVHQAINDPEIRTLVEQLYFREVGPLLDIPAPLTLEGYGQALLRRFNNPDLPHRLAQIAMDGSQKVPIRFLPFLGQSKVLQLALSSWFSYMWRGLQGEPFQISDPRSDELKEALFGDFQETVRQWTELLGWPPRAVELL